MMNRKLIYLLILPVIYAAGTEIIIAQVKPKVVSSKMVGQSLEKLNIGDVVPEYIFNTIPKKSTTKLIILDFWSTTCTSCIAAFSKMEKLKNQFGDQLQVVLVNSYETEGQVRKRMGEINRNRVRNSQVPIVMPAMPEINGDTIFRQLFPHKSVPHHVWINKKGVVLAITSDYNATPEHIQAFLRDKDVKLSIKNDLAGFNLQHEGWMKTTHPNLPTPLIYSALMPFFPGVGYGTYKEWDSVKSISRTTMRNWTVLSLYEKAFKVSKNEVILEVKNKEDFKQPADNNLKDIWCQINMFSYEIAIPSKNEDDVNKCMQIDLNRFFERERGISGRIEKRKLPCLVLVKTTEGMLKTTSSEPKYESKSGKRAWSNYPFKTIINQLSNAIVYMNSPYPFVNETGIDNDLRVDLTINNFNDLDNLKPQLQKYGLDLLKAEREIDVLVISDKWK